MCYVVDENGDRLWLKPRLAAIVKDLHQLQDRLEGTRKGSLEIRFHFSDHSLRTAIREVGESRPIE